MTRFTLATCAALALASCGDGNPFTTVGGGAGDGGDPGAVSNIPESISSAVASFEYNPTSGTLSLTGTLRDGDELTTTFTRKPGLDQGAYQAFTAQDDPLDEHTTVYVRSLGDMSAGVAVTGGQFTYYSGGALYNRTGGFEPETPSEGSDTGLVTYAGDYVGLTNLNGANTDLLAVPGGVPPEVLPAQAGVVNGRIFINVSFDDNNLAGRIYDRSVQSSFGTFEVSDLVLTPTELGEDGTFQGTVEFPSSRSELGEYGGAIGADEGAAMAGAIFVDEHFGDVVDPVTGDPIAITGEEEFGIFVLGKCNGPLGEPSIECSAVD